MTASRPTRPRPMVLAILDEHAHEKALAGREELLRAGGRPRAAWTVLPTTTPSCPSG